MNTFRLIFSSFFFVVLVVARAGQDTPSGASLEHDSAAVALDEAQQALLGVLDGRLTAIEALLAEVGDPAQVASTRVATDELKSRREDLIKGGFDATNFNDLKFDITVEYQRLALWLKLPPVASSASMASVRTAQAPSVSGRRAPTESSAEEAVPQETETEIADHMEDLNVAFRRLRRQVSDPARNEDSLRLAQVMRENARASMKLVPTKAEDIPEGERTEFIADYQAGLASFIEKIEKLEAALSAGNNEVAQEIVTSFRDIQKRGHDRFRKEQ